MTTIPFDTEEKYIENIALLKKIVENQDVRIIGAPFEERLAVSISERDRTARKLYELRILGKRIKL